MSTIPMEKELAKDLVAFKLKRLRTLVQEILDRWNEESTTLFIEKVRKGIYENGENDAIELRQLLLEEKKLEEVEKKIK